MNMGVIELDLSILHLTKNMAKSLFSLFKFRSSIWIEIAKELLLMMSQVFGPPHNINTLKKIHWRSNDLFADFEADAAENAAVAKKVEREGKVRRANMQQEVEDAFEIELEEVEGKGEGLKEVEAEERIRLLLSLIDQVRSGFL